MEFNNKELYALAKVNALYEHENGTKFYARDVASLILTLQQAYCKQTHCDDGHIDFYTLEDSELIRLADDLTTLLGQAQSLAGIKNSTIRQSVETLTNTIQTDIDDIDETLVK